MFCRLIASIPLSNEPCLLMKHASLSYPPVPLSTCLCSVFLTLSFFPSYLFFFSFCWFSFTSSSPDALHSGGSERNPRRGKDLPGMSIREARQRKNLTPNPTPHTRVQLILVDSRSLAWSILHLRRQRMVNPFCYISFFPSKPKYRHVSQEFHILNIIFEWTRNPGRMVLYNLTQTMSLFA